MLSTNCRKYKLIVILVVANTSSLFQQGLKSVDCIGCQEGKTSMFTNGERKWVPIF